MPLPASQRSTDASLLRRLEVANARVRDLTTKNQRLRKQLEHALGQLRASNPAR
ncbi:Tn554 transposase C [Mycobacteroides abscessus subsp. abscessus]|nr:Tn554 transposase C [Mycobacteroides abscessus subsp. abscessus]